MEATQSFRLIGERDIEEISCDHVDGQNVIYLEDIELVFPGFKHVKNGHLPVKPLRDSEQNRCVVGYEHEHSHPPSSQRQTQCVKNDSEQAVLVPMYTLDLYLFASNTTQAWFWMSPCQRPIEQQPRVEPFILPVPHWRRRILPRVCGSHNSLHTHPAMQAGCQVLSHSSNKIHRHIPRTIPRLHRHSVKLYKLHKCPWNLRLKQQQLVSSQPPYLHERVLTSSSIQGAPSRATTENEFMDRPYNQLVTCFQQLQGEMTKNNELASKPTKWLPRTES